MSSQFLLTTRRDGRPMKLRMTLCFTAWLGLAAPAIADVCKYIDRDGNLHYTNVAPEKGWRRLSCGVRAKGPGDSAEAATLGVSAPSILPQCMDTPAPVFGVGPSARARECTRQYCALPEYQAKVTAYAMNRSQPEAARAQAITCIMRAEQDKGGK